jgi:hypothetical protein
VATGGTASGVNPSGWPPCGVVCLVFDQRGEVYFDVVAGDGDYDAWPVAGCGEVVGEGG